MKLIPASSARWMMRIESSWSVLPQAPNIIAPRHSGVTLTPVRPRVRVCMPRASLRDGQLEPHAVEQRARAEVVGAEVGRVGLRDLEQQAMARREVPGRAEELGVDRLAAGRERAVGAARHERLGAV